MKVWATVLVSHRWNVRHRDGRRAGQVWALVRESSRKRAAAALGMSDHELRIFGNEPSSADQAVAGQHDPGVVFIREMDPGDTIDGTTGWRVADPQPVRRDPYPST